MNVYFCDICGVRVTDTDLHSGHGMRRRNDVICAACLELGHGKGWVANHAQKKQMAYAGGVKAGSSPAPQREITTPPPSLDERQLNLQDAADLASEQTIDLAAQHSAPAAIDELPPPRATSAAPPQLELARDRLMTHDEDQPPSPVKPITLLPEAPSFVPEIDDTAKVPVVDQELATAAAGFAALTPPATAAGPTDDIDEAVPVHLDESGPVALDEDGSGAHAADDSGVEEHLQLAEDDEEDQRVSEKAETSSNESVVTGPDEKTDSTGRRSPNRPGRRATSSSRVSKQSKSRSGKRPKNNNQLVMMISGISVLLILIVSVVVIKHANDNTTHGGGQVKVQVGEELVASIRDAWSAAKDADSSRDLDKCKNARNRIVDVRNKISKFESVAKQNGWTDDQIDTQMDIYKVRDLMAMDRTLRDDIEVISGSSTH